MLRLPKSAPGRGRAGTEARGRGGGEGVLLSCGRSSKPASVAMEGRSERKAGARPAEFALRPT